MGWKGRKGKGRKEKGKEKKEKEKIQTKTKEIIRIWIRPVLKGRKKLGGGEIVLAGELLKCIKAKVYFIFEGGKNCWGGIPPLLWAWYEFKLLTKIRERKIQNRKYHLEKYWGTEEGRAKDGGNYRKGVRNLNEKGETETRDWARLTLQGLGRKGRKGRGRGTREEHWKAGVRERTRNKGRR